FFPPCSYALVCTEEGEALAVTTLATDGDLDRYRNHTRLRAESMAKSPPESDSADALHESAPASERPPDAVTPPVFVGEAALLHMVPAFGSTTAERFLALSIASARRTLYVSNSYFVPDDDFRALLTRAVA